MHPTAFIFFGRSGAGKGTQSRLLQEWLEQQGHSVLYIETGARFRAFIEGDSHSAALTRNAMQRGSLLPEFLAAALWGQALIEEFHGTEDLILDGLARREHEAPMLASALSFYGFEHVKVVYVDVSAAWATERLIGRGRSDDGTAAIAEKMAWFEQNTVPAIAYFRNHPNCDFIQINGEQSIEGVHKDIMAALGFV